KVESDFALITVIQVVQNKAHTRSSWATEVEKYKREAVNAREYSPIEIKLEGI
ncbi:hypothetical protein BgiBS90_026637, partial [Biomphalaria glabrata]